MRPEEHDQSPGLDLFHHRLEHMLDKRHELFRLSVLVDWHEFDAAFGPLYCADNGSPAKVTRLMVGLQYLKAIEPVIGPLKADALLGRNYLKGSAGDQMNVMLSCAGHNLRLILRQLWIFCRLLFGHARQLSGPECFVGACKALLVTGFSRGYPWAPSSQSLIHQLHAN